MRRLLWSLITGLTVTASVFANDITSTGQRGSDTVNAPRHVSADAPAAIATKGDSAVVGSKDGPAGERVEGSAGEGTGSVAVDDPLGSELVEVNWIEELNEGGITMVALGVLSIALVAFLLERLLTLRRRRFVPSKLITHVRPLFAEGRFDEISAACDRHPSPAADIIRHCIDYREADFSIMQGGASDIGARAIVDQEEKCNPLAVIAAVAPLLGLLGTMIGMIESFKLVEVFGDEGGASLLAGSISKALITTAVGLVLAIPAVLCYHWARRRVHGIANAIETESESLLKQWFLSRAGDSDNGNDLQGEEDGFKSIEGLA